MQVNTEFNFKTTKSNKVTENCIISQTHKHKTDHFLIPWHIIYQSQALNELFHIVKIGFSRISTKYIENIYFFTVFILRVNQNIHKTKTTTHVIICHKQDLITFIICFSDTFNYGQQYLSDTLYSLYEIILTIVIFKT